MNRESRTKSGREPVSPFEDNRSATAPELKYQQLANSSRQVSQLDSIQETANCSTWSNKAAQLQSMADSAAKMRGKEDDDVTRIEKEADAIGPQALARSALRSEMVQTYLRAGVVQARWIHATSNKKTNLKKSAKKTVFKNLVAGGNLEGAENIMVDEEDPSNTKRRVKAKAYDKEGKRWVEGFINRTKYTVTTKEPSESVKDYLTAKDNPAATEASEEMSYHALFGMDVSAEALGSGKSYTLKRDVDLFHGTQQANKDSILENGLRVGSEKSASGGADMSHWQKNVVGKLFFGTNPVAAKNNAVAFARDNKQDTKTICVIKWTAPQGTVLHTDPDLSESVTYYEHVPGNQLSAV